MAFDDPTTESADHTPRPNPDLRTLERLVGTWRLGGDTAGTVTYDWMEGGFFLIQRFDMTLFGHAVGGFEVSGHWRPFGESPTEDIRSRAYDTVGQTLDCVDEVAGNTLTIWAGERGAPASYRGELSDDGNSCSGAWVYPEGGGYVSTMQRDRADKEP